MLYDGHTHLNDTKLYDSWEILLQNFIDMGGKGLVNQGVSEQWNERGIDIAKKCKNMDIYVKATIGFQPEEILPLGIKDYHIKDIINKLKRQYKENKEFIPAFGECGIDCHHQGREDTMTLQRKILGEICDLSQELDMPLVIHSRDGFEETMDILSNYKNLKLYFHCRGYSTDELKKILNEFPQSYIGFAGNLTYPKAFSIKESFLYCPIERMLMETDAPYLAPQKVRGKTNEPTFVKYIYDFAVQALNVDEEYFQNRIEENFKNFYNII